MPRKKDSNIVTQTSTNRPDNYVRQIKKNRKMGKQETMCVTKSGVGKAVVNHYLHDITVISFVFITSLCTHCCYNVQSVKRI